MNHDATPSPTALMSAAARAAHLLVDAGPPLLVDEQAAALCAAAEPSPLTYQLAAPQEPVLAAARLSATARSRFAEEAARASGCGQHVVLGAGLDTSGHRLPTVTTWLVDLPGVLVWRRERFAAAGLDDVGVPVPADLLVDDVLDALVRAGWDAGRPTAVTWLGTVMYLDDESVERVLARLSGLAVGSHVVLDHLLPAPDRDAAGQAYVDALSAAVGASGEPWRSTLSPEGARSLLARAGWSVVRSSPEADTCPAGFWDRTDALRPQRLVRLVHAVPAG